MNVTKEAELGDGSAMDETELALINRLSRRELTLEEVYTFSMRMCDNEIDRDWERFPPETLRQLAELFVGKSGGFDHEWSAKGQTARIYRTELMGDEGSVTGAGDGYQYLKGYAYMMRTEGNKELIAEIEGGIKKEVSVGCAVSRAVCSVCGEDIHDREKCAHVKGQSYNGRLCWAELQDATDAYEWSFVAVPAQRKAGVMKRYQGGGPVALKKAAEGRPACLAELERLVEDAALGQRYLDGLRKEVVRLGGLAESGMDTGTMSTIVEKLAETELMELKKNYESRVERRYPVGVQLTYRAEDYAAEPRDGAFLI